MVYNYAMADARTHSLLPTQARCLAQLETIVASAPITFVSGHGSGVSVMLHEFAARHAGAFIRAKDAIASWTLGAHGASNLAFVDHLLHVLDSNDLLVIEDIRPLGPNRRFYGDELALSHLAHEVRARGKRLVTGVREPLHIGGSWERARRLEMSPLDCDDLKAWLIASFGEQPLRAVDFTQIERLVSGFNCYELKRLTAALGDRVPISTKTLLETVEQVRGRSNLVLAEVEPLSFDRLPGTAHIAEQLETHVLLPFERPDLARDLDIRAKRGVLLYGPPGSGKTSIGRALAHRMGARFFLIDGAIPTDPPGRFFGTVKAIVEQAKRNAPSVLFIDDADMLFGIVNITGISRYLLSLLDGMESEEASKVCVMMTAMNASKVPAPILRSGRIELWLATNAPDVHARGAIMRQWLGKDMPGHDDVDFAALAAEVENCTPADLRRIVGDARTEFAADIWAGSSGRSAEDYLRMATRNLVTARERMARHLRDDSLRIGTMRDAARQST